MDGVFRRWWIDPDDPRLTPAACVAAPAVGLTLTDQVVDLRSLATNFNSFSAVALIGRHKPDAAVAMLVVAPVHDCRGLEAGLSHAGVAAEGSPAGISPCGTTAPTRGCRWTPRAWRSTAGHPAPQAGSPARPPAIASRKPSATALPLSA